MRFRMPAVIARICLAALATLSAAVSADAAGIPETMAQWGLLGTWASDCAARPSQHDVFYSWVRRGQDAFLERNYGYGHDSNQVVGASVLANGAIELRVEFKAFKETRVNVYIKDNDGRVRMFINHDMQG